MDSEPGTGRAGRRRRGYLTGTDYEEIQPHQLVTWPQASMLSACSIALSISTLPPISIWVHGHWRERSDLVWAVSSLPSEPYLYPNPDAGTHTGRWRH